MNGEGTPIHSELSEAQRQLLSEQAWEHKQYSRFSSRKLLVSLLAMASASGLVATGFIDGPTWGGVTTLTVGSYQYFSWRAKKDGVD